MGWTELAVVLKTVDPNEPEEATIRKIAALTRHGSGTIDIHIRRDGTDYTFEGEWLARLFRPAANLG